MDSSADDDDTGEAKREYRLSSQESVEQEQDSMHVLEEKDSRDDGRGLLDGDDGGGLRKVATPLPLKRIMLVGVILLANKFGLLMIFPFLPFLVEHFFPTLGRTEIGYYAAYLGGIFNVGQLFGSYIWGKLADRHGRRPILIAGLVGTLFSALLFGFNSSYWVSVFARFLWGLLNGNLGVAKTYLSEICDDTNQAKGFSVLGVSNAIGNIVGPLVGGFLSMPADKYPKQFGHPFWENFPVVLPTLVCCLLVVLGLAITVKLVEETLDPALRRPFRDTWMMLPRAMKKIGTCFIHPSREVRGAYRRKRQGRMKLVSEEPAVDVPLSALKLAGKPDDRRRSGESDVLTLDVDTVSNSVHIELEERKGTKADDNRAEEDGEGTVAGDDGGPPTIDTRRDVESGWGKEETAENVDSFQEEYRRRTSTMWYLVRQRSIIASTMIYGMCGLGFQMFMEALPLWLVTPLDAGGFDMDSNQLGLIVMAAAPAAIISQLVLYPRCTKKFGFLVTFRLAAVVSSLLFFLLPWASVTNSWALGWQYTALITMYSLVCMSSIFCFTCSFVFINNSCEMHQKATVNGLGQSIVAVARIVGPVVSGNVFAYFDTNPIAWPLNFHFVFLLTGLSFLCALGLSMLLTSAINRKVS